MAVIELVAVVVMTFPIPIFILICLGIVSRMYVQMRRLREEEMQVEIEKIKALRALLAAKQYGPKFRDIEPGENFWYAKHDSIN